MLHTDTIWQANTQQLQYRALLEAFSRPASMQSIIAPNKDVSALPLLATLADQQVTLFDASKTLTQGHLRHLQAPLTELEQADFIVAFGHSSIDGAPKVGDLANPERSATILVMVDSLTEGEAFTATGPGINGSQSLQVSGLDQAWWTLRESCNSFPLGIDLILCTQNQFLALPRTTQIHKELSKTEGAAWPM